ncbi:MAG TPA: hypothetical protein VNJ01_08670 [Bacteriovoracaceae bacterium]|nr:hypothetical protein [Bacteriovoracaceae bacterium]
MKLVFSALLLSLASFGAFANSVLEDSARLSDCNGNVELRSYVDQGKTRFSLKFTGVKQCSDVSLETGDKYELTDKNGRFENIKTFTLSDKAVATARRGNGLQINVQSNSRAHKDQVTVRIKGSIAAPTNQRPAPQRYEAPRNAPTTTYYPAPSTSGSDLEDSARLDRCNGMVELRSYVDQGKARFSLKFIGVNQCSNVVLESGEKYELTDKNGRFEQIKTFTLSDNAVATARRGNGLQINVKSNSGAHIEHVTVRIKGTYTAPTTQPTEYAPQEWN